MEIYFISYSFDKRTTQKNLDFPQTVSIIIVEVEGIYGGFMGLLPDMQNCGLRLRRERRERFPRHRLQRK